MLLYSLKPSNPWHMAKLNSFTDFEAFQVSRTFVREVGLLIRTPEFRRDRVLFERCNLGAFELCGGF